ncbi:hypothetical protein BDN70DRAFT_879826 [Pholiota conissans]|uniref:Uncharacterized protein n=1 Tax=Pholiota conissans TaxID=109636 RepID=A0A9P6CZS2_9AGAR|nr:hypothetical protein BDN70DRAFT_879826 [Pholiota conissans]
MNSETNQQNVLGLPAPEEVTSSNPTKIDLSSSTATQTVKLDGLGPMVVNSDGTLSRIANWTQMTAAERERTLRVLSARNKLRLANEEKKQQDEAGEANYAAGSEQGRLSILDSAGNTA